MTKRVAIVSCARTGIGKERGQFSTVLPEDLVAPVMNAAIERAGIDPAEIDNVYLGNLQAHHGNIARRAALRAKLPLEVGATTVDRQCASGSQAIALAAMSIMAGFTDVELACGVENMTNEPYQMEKTTAYRVEPPHFLMNAGSVDEVGNPPMPMTADILGAREGILREDCDAWSYRSQMRAAWAISEHLFDEQIVPINIVGKKATVTVTADECVRPDVSLEKMAKLRPLFKGGLTTAGNACPRSDGAGAVLLMSEERARSLNIEPMGYFRGFAGVGLDPNTMGYGPVPATRKLLEREGLTVDDFDIIELNEAFAAQVLPCVRDLKLDPEKVNPNGGAIALGHPTGATGCILATKLLYEMKRRDLQLGLVTMCVGGGQGMATVFERR